MAAAAVSAVARLAGDGSAAEERLVVALVGAVARAREEAIGALAEEARQRAPELEGEAEDEALSAACRELSARLSERGAKRAHKFERLVLDFLLKVPNDAFGEALPVRPGELMQPLSAIEAEEDDMVLDEDPRIDAESAEDECVGRSAEQDQEQLSAVFGRLDSAVRCGSALREDARQLQERLSMLKGAAAAIGSAGRGGGDGDVAAGMRDMVRGVARLMRDAAEAGAAPARPVGSPKRPACDGEAELPEDSPKRLRAAVAAETRQRVATGAARPLTWRGGLGSVF